MINFLCIALSRPRARAHFIAKPVEHFDWQINREAEGRLVWLRSPSLWSTLSDISTKKWGKGLCVWVNCGWDDVRAHSSEGVSLSSAGWDMGSKHSCFTQYSWMFCHLQLQAMPYHQHLTCNKAFSHVQDSATYTGSQSSAPGLRLIKYTSTAAVPLVVAFHMPTMLLSDCLCLCMSQAVPQ